MQVKGKKYIFNNMHLSLSLLYAFCSFNLNRGSWNKTKVLGRPYDIYVPTNAAVHMSRLARTTNYYSYNLVTHVCAKFPLVETSTMLNLQHIASKFHNTVMF